MKRLLPLLLVFIAAMILAQSKPAATGWKAGAATVKITPEKMIWMGGYASRKKPAEGVEQDLFAKALVIEDGQGGKFALITLDLIGVPREVRLHVAEQVEKQFGIPPARLAINASHTHSGPELRPERTRSTDLPDQRKAEVIEYVDQLQTSLVALVGEALKKAAPATLDFSQARCGFAMNRRTPNADGSYSNFPNPEGPVDHAVPVLQVADAQGKDLCYVFGYACHCTTQSHQKFNADYAGYAQAELEKAHPGTVAMFMNGCSGDQNPYPRRNEGLAKTHGITLATAVEAALGTRMKPLTGEIQAAYEEIPLAYDTLPTRDELLEKQKSKVKLDADHATRTLQLLDQQGALPQTYPYPVQVIRLGPELTWVMLAGEVVVDYSLRLKREFTDPWVWVSAYTNDVPSYIPSLRVWKEGGYEGGDAMKWGAHPTRWSPKVEEQIIGTAKKLRASME